MNVFKKIFVRENSNLRTAKVVKPTDNNAAVKITIPEFTESGKLYCNTIYVPQNSPTRKNANALDQLPRFKKIKQEFKNDDSLRNELYQDMSKLPTNNIYTTPRTRIKHIKQKFKNYIDSQSMKESLEKPLNFKYYSDVIKAQKNSEKLLQKIEDGQYLSQSPGIYKYSEDYIKQALIQHQKLINFKGVLEGKILEAHKKLDNATSEYKNLCSTHGISAGEIKTTNKMLKNLNLTGSKQNITLIQNITSMIEGLNKRAKELLESISSKPVVEESFDDALHHLVTIEDTAHIISTLVTGEVLNTEL